MLGESVGKCCTEELKVRVLLGGYKGSILQAVDGIGAGKHN
jgi:hypothetical protein